MIYSLDIETKSITEDKDDALIPWKSVITIIGVWNPLDAKTFNNVKDFDDWCYKEKPEFVTHNGKFDYKHLFFHGSTYMLNWIGDTHLMAVTSVEKIDDKWLADYEVERKIKNDLGGEHRGARHHSLKTLAPYFLQVDRFWEVSDKDNKEYVLKDAEYTYKLYIFFKQKLKEQKDFKFYSKLFEWTKFLTKVECDGITLDTEELQKQQESSAQRMVELEAKLDEIWGPFNEQYFNYQRTQLLKKYEEKYQVRLISSKDKEKTLNQYKKLFYNAALQLPKKINYGSPKQLNWLFKDCLKLDITDFNNEESTGRLVLEKLASSGREDIKVFLEYRKVQKLLSAFYPTYKKLVYKGKIHTNYNPGGTRTGRLSSSVPNLQQVAGPLHALFRASPGHQLITFDMSAIEPKLLAYYTEDPVLFKIIQSGEDFHAANAKLLFNLNCEVSEVEAKYPKARKVAKTVGLAIMYGAGANRLKEVLAKEGFFWSIHDCKKALYAFRDAYNVMFRWRDELNKKLEAGYKMLNLFGRPFKFNNPDEVYMKGLNTLIQSSASDLVLNSAYKAAIKLGQTPDTGIRLLVHDELVLECPTGHVPLCSELLEHYMTDYSLTTSLGPVILKVKGSVNEIWKK